jgi:hypothetical protein
MSFGFGISDVLAVSWLAWSVYKSCKEAPKDFQDISSEVIGGPESNPWTRKQDQLRELVAGCHDVLTELDALVT